MMNLRLNFLPENEIKKIKIISLIYWLKNFFINLFFILIIYNIFLLLLSIVLMEQQNLLSQRSLEISQGHTHINKEIEEINKQLISLNKAGGNFGLLTPRFWTIISSTPINIYLKNLNLSLDQNTKITLNGIAKDRDSLLKFEDTLQSISWVENVMLPTSQLLQKENIAFSIELTTKPPSSTEYPLLIE